MALRVGGGGMRSGYSLEHLMLHSLYTSQFVFSSFHTPDCPRCHQLHAFGGLEVYVLEARFMGPFTLLTRSIHLIFDQIYLLD